MHYRQKTWKVVLSRIFSYVFLISISSCLLLYLAGIWFSITEGNSSGSILSATFDYLIIMSGMAVFGIYHLWKFPDIFTSDHGIDLRVLFYTMHIEWKNIVQVQKRNKRLLIFLGNKGLPLNRLYGLFDAKVWDRPVVLFISNEEVVNQLEEDIKAHLSGA